LFILGALVRFTGFKRLSVGLESKTPMS